MSMEKTKEWEWELTQAWALEEELRGRLQEALDDWAATTADLQEGDDPASKELCSAQLTEAKAAFDRWWAAKERREGMRNPPREEGS